MTWTFAVAFICWAAFDSFLWWRMLRGIQKDLDVLFDRVLDLQKEERLP